MKLNKYSWLAALPLLFTACQDDMLVEKHSQQGIYTLTASMDGGANSRAQIVLNGTSTTKESFHWNEGDKFTLFQNTDINNDWSKLTWATHEFSIDENYDESKPASSVDFSTTDSPNILLQGNKFVAIYPNLNVRDDAMNVVRMKLEQELEDNSEDSWKDYFKKNMFMLAEGVIAGNSVSTNVTFQQLCGLIRITYTNDTKVDKNLKRIFMDGVWVDTREYFINNEDRVTNYNYELAQEDYGLTFTGEEGAIVPAGESVDFYFLFFPVENKMMQTISIEDMDENVITTPSYRDAGGSFPFVFESGKCYWMKITDNGDELLWTKYLQGSGNDNVTSEVIEVSTFAELKQALAVQADELIVVLKNNIALETPLTVSSLTTLEMQGYELSIADNYDTRESYAVFEIFNRLNVNNGSLKGKDGANLHEYYFMLNGTHTSLNLRGISLNTGTAIMNAVFMDDDNFHLEDYMIWNETDQTETAIPSSITTSGNAIHYVANNNAPRYWSYINGNIDGDIYVESQHENSLNAMMLFQSGTINGNLNTTNVNSSIVLSDYIQKSSAVTIGSGYTGWDKVGLYVEDQRYSVSTFEELKAAIETPQVADEATEITLLNDITLESPLTVNKVTRIFGIDNQLIVSESFNWGDFDAVFINNGNDPFGLVSVSFNGCATTQLGKYMVRSVDGRFYMTNASMTANGIKHGVYLEDSQISLFNNANITTREGGYALDFVTVDSYIQIYISEMTGTVTGDVRFKADYVDSKYPNVIHLFTGTYNGNLIREGTYADQLIVSLDAGVTVNGEGWSQPD